MDSQDPSSSTQKRKQSISEHSDDDPITSALQALNADRERYVALHNSGSGSSGEMEELRARLNIDNGPQQRREVDPDRQQQLDAFRDLFSQQPRRQMNHGSPVNSANHSPLDSPLISPASSRRASIDLSALDLNAMQVPMQSPMQSPLQSPVQSPRQRPRQVQRAPNVAWNSSTKVDKPLSQTATQMTKRKSSTAITPKIASKHW